MLNSHNELLNDPNYGLVLCFLDKFRSILNLPKYSFELFEKHLIKSQESIPARWIDFHFHLLKRLSLAKNARRENFDTIINKFVARFDFNDHEYLTTHGYLQADIHLKLRILKNLLENQLDFNQHLRNTFLNQTSTDIRSFPIGHDRFGVSYWLFIENCFLRLFREDIDIDRTWTIISKTRDELENFIKILISDSVIQKKFTDWSLNDERFDSIAPSNEFEENYSPISIVAIENDEENIPIKRKRGRPKRLTNDEESLASVKNKRGRPRKQLRRSSNDSDYDETSIDDVSLASRLTKSSINKRKTKSSKIRRRKMSSSSDEQTDYDYLFDEDDLFEESTDHFFEFDDDSHPVDQPIRLAKTVQTSTISTNCLVCSKDDHPEVLLLCDNCNDGYHLDCLRPQLLSVPNSNWFCPLCQQKQLIINLISKYQQLCINENKSKPIRTIQRKIKLKEYSSDESITASENDEVIVEDESISLSSSINENNVSQRGRHRRARFDMKEIFDEHQSDSNHNNEEDDWQVTDFHLELPKKITRLLHRRNRKSEQQMKTLSFRSDHTSADSNDTIELNDKLGSPLVYVNSDSNHRQMKSVITNSKHTLKIVRRWNDVQRRSRLKALQMKNLHPSELADENSNFPLETYFNHYEIKDEEETSTKINLLLPIDKLTTKNSIKTLDANFDRLTRDIQGAINDAHLSSTKSIDQQSIKRPSKKFSSPFLSKPLNISKIKDTFDLSNSILTPSSSSSDGPPI